MSNMTQDKAEWTKNHPSFVRKYYPVWYQSALASAVYCRVIKKEDEAKRFEEEAEEMKEALEMVGGTTDVLA